ncbi:hypothetical protein [Streptomyces stelliscabiei]|uniref:hypothetical protein n=1 Tax=Streptomyces stelliscabiei TaxID=146820 RepID=UPI002FF396A6
MTDTTDPQPPPMDRGAKAEALLLRFTAEAHRRKWNYDRGLDDDGQPIKSEAFDALHRLGEEMRVELEKLRALPASVVVPAADRATLRDRIADKLATADGWKWAPGFKAQSPAWRGYQERADMVLAELPAPADQAAVRAEAFDEAAETLAAAVASCPGYETSPNPCRCPCYGCKHHCSAHDPEPGPVVEAQPGKDTETPQPKEA